MVDSTSEVKALDITEAEERERQMLVTTCRGIGVQLGLPDTQLRRLPCKQLIEIRAEHTRLLALRAARRRSQLELAGAVA